MINRKIKIINSLKYHLLIFANRIKCPTKESITKEETKSVAKKVNNSPLYLVISIVINSVGMPKYLQKPSS